MTEDKELEGRVAIITGAGRNIGRAIALDLARAGAAVIVNVRSNEQEAEEVAARIQGAGGRAAIVLGDVAHPDTGEKLARAAKNKFGRIDILVNNAALRRETALEDMSFEEWREITGTILDGAFRCTKAALPELKKSGSGTIVNIGGMSGHVGAKHRAHVITAKSGLIGLTKALAHELADYGINVNCVVPGMIDTPAGKPASGPRPQHYQFAQPLNGRKGTVEELSGMVRYLCGPKARYITGQALHVNGGAYMG
ncbi:MAG TPA: 3-oxoacyl-ACP reductase family protein [Xanthobacteraceae bacterium]|nr:3-oxoacyl-ACP reductase family protein [Xanthobacteraceae bacterium]